PSGSARAPRPAGPTPAATRLQYSPSRPSAYSSCVAPGRALSVALSAPMRLLAPPHNAIPRISRFIGNPSTRPARPRAQDNPRPPRDEFVLRRPLLNKAGRAQGVSQLRLRRQPRSPLLPFLRGELRGLPADLQTQGQARAARGAQLR